MHPEEHHHTFPFQRTQRASRTVISTPQQIFKCQAVLYHQTHKLLQNSQHHQHKGYLQPLHTLDRQRKHHCYLHHQHQRDKLTTETTIDNSFQDGHHPVTIEIQPFQDHQLLTTDFTSNYTFQDHIWQVHCISTRDSSQDHTHSHQDTSHQCILHFTSYHKYHIYQYYCNIQTM